MRLRFEHAAASRTVADPVLVEVAGRAPYAQHVGTGETLARTYVTGETTDSVVRDIRELFAPRLVEFRPTSFPDALEFIEALPGSDEGRIVNAARCGVELALLDLAGRAFNRSAADVAGWLGLGGFGPPGCIATARYSGIVLGKSPGKIAHFLRLQRCYGLRDFKIKVAIDGWQEHLAAAHRFLGPAIARNLVTLRADANGGWSREQAEAAIPWLEKCSVVALEQPLPDSMDDQLPALAAQTGCRIVADESMLTLADARRLIQTGAAEVLNIRLAKNGGLLPSLRIAHLALSRGAELQLGCLVGETSILTAAGTAFLRCCPQARYVEGAFGRILLKDDVVDRTIHIRPGGRVRPPTGHGLGISVLPAAIARLSQESLVVPLG